jgi:hypothetical protein
MRKAIKDKFTKLPISRQRKYQLRMRRDHRCVVCGAPATLGSRCLKHMVEAREQARKKHGLKRRNYRTKSYKLERRSKQQQPGSAVYVPQITAA